MIQINHLTRKFGDKIAVNDISLCVKNGEVLGLLGPNGAGKSTTLKCITGILSPSEGEIYIDDVSIKEKPVEAKKKIGFVSDSPDVFLGMKGYEYLSFIASVFHLDREKAKRNVERLAKQFHIYDSLTDFIANYSHGMRQKIFLIGSLLSDSNNWILDEPLTGLDPEAAFEIKSMMKERAKENKSVLFSTHVLDVAEKICDRLAVIDKGRLLFVGTLEELRNKEGVEKEDLESLFLTLTGEKENR